MPAKKQTQQTSEPAPSTEAIDRLYEAPLEEFVGLRRELAGALRASGDVAASRLMATAAKPTRIAWALNQVARRRPELLRGVFSARDEAAAAQKPGDGERVRSTVRLYRERVADVARAVRDVLAQVGIGLSAAQVRRVGESLLAASAGQDEVRAQLLAGRLVRELDVDEPSWGLDLGPTESGGPIKGQPEQDNGPAKGQADAQAVRERAVERERVQREHAIEEGRRRVASLEEKAREARALAREAEIAASRAQLAAERTRRAVTDVERQLEQARVELRALPK